METEARNAVNRIAALSLAFFLAQYNWPLRVPTGEMTPSRIWSHSNRELAQLLKMPSQAFSQLVEFRRQFSPSAALRNLEQKGVLLIALGDPDYPDSLAQIHDPPPALFLRANQPARLNLCMQRPRVAVVGSRAATKYGLDATREIARGLARQGVCVVSGMALGIDAAAHRAAITEPGGSIAVLGCGPDIIYPRGNRRLYRDLCEHGLVISEYPPGTSPMPWRFPARNRIMSGLSQAVIVIEAGHKSGALITADFCLEEGREVMAVPGSIFSELSAGPHQLIRNGAGIAASAGEVLEILGIDNDAQLELEMNPTAAPSNLTGDEKKLYMALDARPCHQDVLASKAGVDGARAATALVALEILGLARLEPSRGYCR